MLNFDAEFSSEAVIQWLREDIQRLNLEKTIRCDDVADSAMSTARSPRNGRSLRPGTAPIERDCMPEFAQDKLPLYGNYMKEVHFRTRILRRPDTAREKSEESRSRICTPSMLTPHSPRGSTAPSQGSRRTKHLRTSTSAQSSARAERHDLPKPEPLNLFNRTEEFESFQVISSGEQLSRPLSPERRPETLDGHLSGAVVSSPPRSPPHTPRRQTTPRFTIVSMSPTRTVGKIFACMNAMRALYVLLTRLEQHRERRRSAGLVLRRTIRCYAMKQKLLRIPKMAICSMLSLHLYVRQWQKRRALKIIKWAIDNQSSIRKSPRMFLRKYFWTLHRCQSRIKGYHAIRQARIVVLRLLWEKLEKRCRREVALDELKMLDRQRRESAQSAQRASAKSRQDVTALSVYEKWALRQQKVDILVQQADKVQSRYEVMSRVWKKIQQTQSQSQSSRRGIAIQNFDAATVIDDMAAQRRSRLPKDSPVLIDRVPDDIRDRAIMDNLNAKRRDYREVMERVVNSEVKRFVHLMIFRILELVLMSMMVNWMMIRTSMIFKCDDYVCDVVEAWTLRWRVMHSRTSANMRTRSQVCNWLKLRSCR